MAGGGVGEAMLIGAITGGATSAATGGDPLKGALLGATTGGVGAGVAGATTGATAGTTAGLLPLRLRLVPAAAAPAVTAGLDATLASANTTASAALPSASAPLTTAGVDGAGLTSAGASEGLNLAGGSTDAGLKYAGVPQGASIDPFSLNYADPLAGSTVGATPTPVAAAENPMFPSINKFYAANPIAAPAGTGALASALGDTKRDEEEEEEEEEYSGALKDFKYTRSGYTPYRAAASGGLMDTAVARRLMSGGQLGSYSDGGQALQGPGDGMSDSIPGVIGDVQPARLADGEFVVPADVVSGIGNGSTDAGSRQLYAMMDKIREARTGRAKQAPEINPRKMMPA
jgi:hypothetical protein